jgi:acyl-CoA thioester hydrolase
MIAGDHRHRHPGIDDIGQRGKRAKTPAGNDGPPLEPELEQVPVDDERAGVRRNVAQKGDDRAFDVAVREPQVRVGHDVARRVEMRRVLHARILSSSRSLYKRMRSGDLRLVTNDARLSVPSQIHHDVEFRVRYAETDQMGVVYHTNYLIWCEVGRTDFIRARGMSYADIERAGIGLAVSEVRARFHAAARYDEMIRVRTTLAELRSRGITFDYQITTVDGGRRLVTARTALVSIDPSGRPVALPPAVRALFES